MHPALGQDLSPSPTAHRAQAGSDARDLRRYSWRKSPDSFSSINVDAERWCHTTFVAGWMPSRLVGVGTSLSSVVEK
jgi:hypothetical protein